MNKLSSVKKITITAVCIALCCVLPMAFHAFGLEHAFSPMHIPALLCGFISGPLWGCVMGAVAPLLRQVLFGMPPLMAASSSSSL